MIFLVVLPSMAACVTIGPDYQRPNLLSASAWNSGARTEQPQLADWWKNLKDPVLDQLIAEGIATSPDVATAKAKVRQAWANFTGAGGALYPSLNADGSYTRAGSVSSSVSFGFSTQWELDLFGANRRGAEAAYYNMESVEQQLRAALVALIGDIATNYVQLRSIQASIVIANRNAGLQRQTVTLTRNRLEAGSISQVDLLSAETQAATTESQIPSLRITYATYLNTLSVLTGRSSIDLANKLKKTRHIPSAPAKVSAGLPADLLLSRPDIRAAERDYASSTANIGYSQGALYPRVSLVGNISTGSTDFGDLAQLSTIGWNFGPNVSVPIFNTVRLRSEVDVARSSRDQAFIGYRKAILVALSEVENASVALNQNRLLVAQQQVIVRNSRQINELTLEQYDAGRKSFIDVLTAQRGLLTVETTLTQARTDLVLSYIALQKALGGGWNGRVDVGKPEIIDSYTGPHFADPVSQATPTRKARQL